MTAHRQPVVFGEVLFDCFPDGEEVLGGAPFNVAWHLQGFGASPLLVTATGDDERAATVAERMAAWGLTDRGVQRRAGETAMVEVQLEHGQASFSIPADQLFDRIDLEPAVRAVTEPVGLLYRGTLAARDRHSRHTVERLADQLAVPVFVDLNLRRPWWSAELIESSVRGASWVKLNQDELVVASGRQITSEDQLVDAAERWRARFELDVVVVTRGELGAVLVAADGQRISVAAPRVDQLVDTVGAGDGFSAVCCLGLVQGWPVGRTLRRAVAFAARLCQMRGATALDAEPYRATLEQWRMEGGGDS